MTQNLYTLKSRPIRPARPQPTGLRYAVIRKDRETGVERQIGFSRGTPAAAGSACQVYAARLVRAGNGRRLTYFVREVQAR